MKSPGDSHVLRRIAIATAAVACLVAGGAVTTLVVGGRHGSGAAGHGAAASHVNGSSDRLVSTAIFERPQVVPVSAVPSAGLPADCVPRPSGPPSSYYQLGLVGTAKNGVLDTGTTRVINVNVKFCAVVTIVNGSPPCAATGSVSSPQDGQVFGTVSASLTMIPGMAPKVPFKAHPGTITGGFTCASTTNGLRVNLDATVSGTTGLFGLSCTIGPFTVPLSGVLTGPFTDASIILRGNDFVVPGVSTSSRCPGNVPAGLDSVAGLPIPRGQATLTLPATVSLYRPPAP
jgi:hypothetical protein